jgi:flagellar biosynthesis protein FliP
MLQWIRKHRKALAGISVGAGAFFAAISFITYKVMAAEETTASGNNLINIGISTSDGNDMASVLQMLLVLTVISLAPSILIMLTSFTRIVIVLHFTRAALGTQTVPPNQVIIGLSLFLTFFVMSPVFTEVYDSALKPLSNNEISVEEAYETGVKPLKSFIVSILCENILNHHSHECSIITNQNILCHKLSPIQKQIIHKNHSNVLYNKYCQFPTLFLIF